MNDLRYALRRLRKAPGFTAVAVLTLALGMGATVAIYTLLDRIVLDSLPYPDAERLVQLTSPVPGVGPGEEWHLSQAEYFYFGRETTSLETIGAFNGWAANVLSPSGPERVSVALVTTSVLPLLGARVVLGRGITDDDDRPGAPPIVVLSHGYWARQFGSQRDAIARSLTINERPYEIVGVLAPGVELPNGTRTDLWMPRRFNPAGPFYNQHTFPMIGRLAPGVSLERAQAELDRLTARLPEAFPQVYTPRFMERTGFRTRVYSLRTYVVGDLSRNLWILFGGVGLVMLIAAANVANLILVRVESRRREVAVRLALGAGRRAILRQFLAESLTLTAAAGAIALFVAYWSVAAFSAIAPEGIPRLDDLRVDAGIWAFTLGLSLVVALSIVVLPVLHMGHAASLHGRDEGRRVLGVGRERQRLRGTLVVIQMALALVLVVAAGLLVESLRRLRRVDPGFDPAGVLVVRLNLPTSRYSELSEMWRFYRGVFDRLRAIPGVIDAGVSWSVPLTGTYGCTVQAFDDDAVSQRLREAGQTACADMAPVSPGFFDALGIPLLAGRPLTALDNDQPHTGSVVVSKAFAERFWPGEDPIGKGVAYGGGGSRVYRVVGVVGDVRGSSLDEPPVLGIYYPIVAIPGEPRWWPETMYLVVRGTDADPMSLVNVVRAAVAEVDPTIPLANAEAMEAILKRSMVRLSFTMTLLGIAASVALLLAALGLYGVVSYVVERRTNEIGVRMALGARPAEVQSLVIRRALALAALGLGGGAVGALVLTRALRGLLFGIESVHPQTYLVAVFVLTAVAMTASWLPARRAARVDPMEALRYE